MKHNVPSLPPKLPEFISDNYTLTEMLGEGGMGTVYLAKDTRLHRTVAIKVLHRVPEQQTLTSPQIQALDEARSLAKVNHPNIVQIYDVLVHQDQVALVMEYLSGKTLQQFQNEQVTTLIQKLQILHQISLGLDAAHHVGIVHCDLKASNIIITAHSDDNSVTAKVVDFGIAQTQQLIRDTQALTPTSTLNESLASQGSKIAMSPEQLAGQPINHLSDLFSFGLLAYNFISGHHPFGTGSINQIGDSIINQNPRDASELIPNIPPALASLLNQLLQKQPADRVQSAKQVADKIKQIIIALTQEEILQQQTVANAPVYDSLTANKEALNPTGIANVFNRVSKRGIVLITTFISVLVILLLTSYPSLLALMNTAPSSATIKHQVVVIPPTLESTNLTDTAESNLLMATMDDAIRQYIIHNDAMQLISSAEVDAIEGGINAIGNYTGATDILTSEINCDITRCNITLSRLNKSSNSQRWTVSEQDHWPTILQNFYATHNDTQLKVAKLFSDNQPREQVNQQISEQDYLTYIDLYSTMLLEGKVTPELMQSLATLIKKTPYLYSAYSLYRESALSFYTSTNDEKFFHLFKEILDQSPPEYRYSVEQAIDKFTIYASINEFDKAHTQLNIAKQRGANKATFIEFQAYFFLASNQLDLAISTYQKALSLRPSTKLLYNLALSYWWQSDSKHTKKTLKTLLSINPKHYFANQLLADISLIEGDLEQAIALYRPLVATNHQSIDFSNLGLSYALSGQYQQALQMAQLAVDTSPNHPNWILNLADIQLILGKTNQAHVHYQQVLNLNQGLETRSARLQRAQAYVHIGEHRAAIKALNQLKKISTNDGEVFFVAALIYTRIGEHISALSQVEEALNSNIGAAWFNLPWFDSLCEIPKFNQLLEEADKLERCQLKN
ncbi:protein kinase [Shewanella sp. D64]|uniref:serine/threonine-protein kinase n=1 Tax=unclassified Shewanella TaxID=196818 RepID=UPI0022BA40A4|nr:MULTISPECIES: serine/threonine-protein kinase [unclassified Shewanella]MEC4725743.1 protein kinase [Shewanella sp. D64]MEC4737650.1 protein kinase [Shewanella sp. E94]WBJ93459.1 protein kinase [Shewanella sp. MTB7]